MQKNPKYAYDINNAPYEAQAILVSIADKNRTGCMHGYGNRIQNNQNNQNFSCQCTSIGFQIKQYIDQGKDMSTTFDPYLKLLVKSHNHHYHIENQCLYKDQQVKSDILSTIMKIHRPSPAELCELVKFPCYDNCFVSMVFENPKFNESGKLDFSILQSAVAKRFKDSHKTNDPDDVENRLVDLLFEFTNIPNNTTTFLATYGLTCVRHYYFNNKLAQLLEKSDLCNDTDENTWLLLFKYLPYTMPIITMLMAKGWIISSKCIEHCCKYTSVADIFKILELSNRIPITKEHFNAVITAQSSKVASYYYRSADDFAESGSGYTPQKLELLITHGYKITYDDIVTSIKYKIVIPDIDRFGIVADKALLDMCYNNNFYPPYKFEGVDLNMITLQKLCLEGHIAPIRQFLNSHKTLVPDGICMRNICRNKRSVNILALLDKHNPIYTTECIKACSTYSHNPVLDHVIVKYTEAYTKEIAQYKATIKELEAALEAAGISKQPAKPNEITKDSVPIEANPVEVNSDSSFNEFNDDDINEMIDSCKTVEEETTILDIVENTVGIPKQKGRTMKLPKLYSSYFKTTTKMSFMDIKKDFINKIREKGWYNAKNKALIELPKDLKTVLSLPTTGLIKFEDLDKLITHFYK
jgi:hypothetical protein